MHAYLKVWLLISFYQYSGNPYFQFFRHQSPPPKPLRLVRGEGLSLTLFGVVEDLLSVFVGDEDDFDGEEGEDGDFAATTSVLF